MRILCPFCKSPNVRARPRGTNATGEPKDHVVQILITCLDCPSESDVSADVARAEAAGEEVMIGAQRLRRTVEK